MRFTITLAAGLIAGVLAAPVPQLAGEGAACNSVLSSTDNGVGYGVENAEDNTANTIKSTGAKVRRQLAGEGAACNSILSSTDNGVGYGVENAEDNTANTISSTGVRRARRQLAGEGAACNSVLSSTDNGVGYGVENAEDNTANTIKSTGAKARRQLDKISNGAGAVGTAAGVGTVTGPVQSTGDSLDGTLTSGAANAGAQVGNTEASTLEQAGSDVPKARRQLDKISNGAGAIGNAAGVGAVTSPVQSTGDSLDGTLTSGAANAGAQVGNTEASTLEQAGSDVPKN